MSTSVRDKTVDASSGVAGIPIIDSDSHVVEPPDLWTSRISSRFSDDAPRVVWDERRSLWRWQVGDRRLAGVAAFASAGWPEFPPSHPPTLDEADPASWDSMKRLERLDEYGIQAQVLYPNILAFYSHAFMHLDPALSFECVRAYNDFLAEFAAADPDRLIPLMFIPFWDLEASLAELHRATDLGHRGVVFGVDFAKLGLPPITDPHWSPLLAAAQDANLSINFHVGVASASEEEVQQAIRLQSRAQFAMDSAIMMLGNAKAVAAVLTSDLCVRFPRLKFVSVESGAGWIPSLLEGLDWQWKNSGAAHEHADRELPSFYFHRQVYGMFWYEQESLRRCVDLLSDNLMFETDFPHPTALCPGPASYSETPRVMAARSLDGVSMEVARKVLFSNAARLYGVPDALADLA